MTDNFAGVSKNGDTIYRQAAIDAAMECGKKIPPYAIRVKKAIEQLPSAQPEIIRCKDCKYFPEGTGVNNDLEFPEEFKCPCECEDYWYSWKPDDDWYCANGKRKEEKEHERR